MEIFAKRLKALREQNEISQTALAKKLGVNPTTIYKWEKATTEPKASHIVLLAEFFEVSSEYLLGTENNMWIKKYSPPKSQIDNLSSDGQELLAIFNSLEVAYQLNILEYSRYFAEQFKRIRNKKNINWLKYCTVLLFRIYNWSQLRYLNFVDAISNESTRYFEFLLSIGTTKKDSHWQTDLYKKLFQSLDNNGYRSYWNVKFSKKLLNNFNASEKRLFSCLPNDEDTLLSALYLFFLPQKEHNHIYDMSIQGAIRKLLFSDNEAELLDYLKTLKPEYQAQILEYARSKINKTPASKFTL